MIDDMMQSSTKWLFDRATILMHGDVALNHAHDHKQVEKLLQFTAKPR